MERDASEGHHPSIPSRVHEHHHDDKKEQDESEGDAMLLKHLAGAGEAPLLHVLRKFQKILQQNGLSNEAHTVIAEAEAQYAAFLRRSEVEDGETLNDNDLVLRDGFRKYLEYVEPTLPPIHPQVSSP